MVLGRFKKIAKVVVKRAAKEILERTAGPPEETWRAEPVRAAEPAAEPSAALESDQEQRPAPVAVQQPARKKPKKARSTDKTTSSSDEPLPTRTMARLLMRQGRWRRALHIYDCLMEAPSPEGAQIDVALAVERMTALHALAEEEESAIEWRVLCRTEDVLCIQQPSTRDYQSGADRPIHFAILCFDRSALVEWHVGRDDRVSAEGTFSFEPTRAGDYAVAAVDRDGSLLWATPMLRLDAT